VNRGWLFSVGDEAHELGYPNMFTDMFDAIENNRQPLETFYDSYIVNAILDAAFASVKSSQWEAVKIDDWRGEDEINETTHFEVYDDQYYLVKQELLPSGERRLILKDKQSGKIVQQSSKV
jgi:hypothetical protein